MQHQETINQEGETGTLYHILSAEGEFLGSTRAPAQGQVMNGHFLGIVTDRESDQADYKVWKLHPSAEDFIYP